MESSGQRKLSAVPSFVPEEDAASRLLDVVWDVPIGLGLCDTGLNFVRVNEALAGLDGLPVDAHYELFPGVCHLHYPALPGSSRRPALRIECNTAASPRCAARSRPTSAGCGGWDRRRALTSRRHVTGRLQTPWLEWPNTHPDVAPRHAPVECPQRTIYPALPCSAILWMSVRSAISPALQR